MAKKTEQTLQMIVMVPGPKRATTPPPAVRGMIEALTAKGKRGAKPKPGVAFYYQGWSGWSFWW